MITASGFDNAAAAPSAVLAKLPVVADTKGRLRVTKAQRREILAALARSGESLPRFARRTGLRYSTLARWVQTQRPPAAGRLPRLRLVEAVMASAPVTVTVAPLVLQLPGGVQLFVADEKQAALAAILVRALQPPC